VGKGRVSIALRVAGHLDAIQGVVANTLNLLPDGAVGFIDWLDDQISNLNRIAMTSSVAYDATASLRRRRAGCWRRANSWSWTNSSYCPNQTE
jgi:phage portal protein BeeE